MSKYYKYKKSRKKNYRKLFRFLSLVISLLGVLGIIYVFLPLISWQIYFAPIAASQTITAPIPRTTIVSSSTIQSLLTDAISGVDYTNAQNWFPSYSTKNVNNKVSFFTLSIPKLGIKDAVVSTIDNDLGSHLVNYGGTALPPDNGTSVIFGHSTLPQWFNPKDYRAIFATLYTLTTGDEFFVNVEDIEYKYKIHNVKVVDPTDTSIFTQDYDTSHIALVTCTPPGTTWKRLVLSAKLEKIYTARL
ncbi:MAG: sortase [bacterium]|nr:sortase [bacterium]